MKLINKLLRGGQRPPTPPEFPTEQMLIRKARDMKNYAEQTYGEGRQYYYDRYEQVLRELEAERTAKRILWDSLSDMQRQEFSEGLTFTVIGGVTGRKYTINFGAVSNVQSGERRYCAIPKGKLPMGDILLAQKLAIEANEELYLRTAF